MYVNLEAEPKSTDVIARYRVIPKEPYELHEAIELLAAEASIGPWNVFWKANDEIGNSLKPTVFSIN